MSSQLSRDTNRRRNAGADAVELPCPYCPRVAIGKDALDAQRARAIHISKKHLSGRVVGDGVPREYLPNRHRNFDSAALLDRIAMRMRRDERRPA